MGALRLVPLLASLQMLLPPGSPADLLPPPAIAVTPVKAEYLIGDTVSIRCVAPGSPEKMEGFQFRGTGGWAAHVRTARRTYVYSFNVTGPRDGGAQVCAYAVTDRFRQTRRSRESEAVVISVRDRPPRPALAAPGVVIEGQPLVLLCTAPAGAGERRFRFYKGRGEIGAGGEPSWGEAEGRLRVTESRRNHTGNFTCAYQEETEGRWILSYPSRAVEVLVKGAAPAPRLGVEPAGGLASEGYPLGLTCAASRADFGLRFRFYRNGAEIPPGRDDSQRETVGNVARLRFPRSPGGFGGKFTCRVEEDAGGTWVPSPPSQAVDVIVKDLPSPPALLSDPPAGQALDGEPLVLTCAAPPGPAPAGPAPTGPAPPPRRFSFYEDGAERFSARGAGGRALLRLPPAEAARAAARFTCRYEEKLGDWWIPSPFSPAITLRPPARSRLLPLVGGCAAGAGVLLLGLLLAVCLRWRRRGGVRWKGLRNRDDASTYPMVAVSADALRP